MNRVREGSSCAQLDERWARSAPARLVRAAVLRGFFGPILTYYTRRRRIGRDRLAALTPPVVFVANHSSHIDTPIVLSALPRPWRHRTVVAAAADYFYRDGRRAALVSLLFNTVPVRREGGGTADLGHVDELLDQGWSLLVYPEGTRQHDGGSSRLRTGAAVLAAKHRIAIVPVHLTGTRHAMPPGQIWPRRKLWQRRHAVELVFGDPIWPVAPEQRRAVIEQVEAFFAEHEADERGRQMTFS